LFILAVPFSQYLQFYIHKQIFFYYDKRVTKRTMQVGRAGEKQAAQYLVEHGVAILETNYRSSYGEIDIIGKMADQIIFFEVKTRTSRTCGYPEESITPKKKKNLIETALTYLQETDQLMCTWRIDVISILLEENELKYEWFENAVTSD